MDTLTTETEDKKYMTSERWLDEGSQLSPAEIVDENSQNILMYLRDSDKDNCFSTGDVANRIISQSRTSGIRVTDDQVYRAVSVYRGRSPRTIRYYAETSLFYNENIRTLYSHLSFSVFVFARSFDDWQNVLDLASEHPSWSVERLKQSLLTPSEEIPTTPVDEICEVSQDYDDKERVGTLPESGRVPTLSVAPAVRPAGISQSVLSEFIQAMRRFDEYVLKPFLDAPGELASSTPEIVDAYQTAEYWTKAIAERVSRQ